MTGGSELRRRIGIVLQECGIDPYLSVTDVLQTQATSYTIRVPSTKSSNSWGSGRSGPG